MDAEKVKVMKNVSEYGATYMADLLSCTMVMETMYSEELLQVQLGLGCEGRG